MQFSLYRKTRTGLALLCLTFALPCAAANVYKCRNAQGVLEYQGMPCTAQKQAVSAWNAAIDPDLPKAPPLIIKSRQGGHYFVAGAINGNPVKFLIDTGATTLSLPIAMKKTAQLTCQREVMMNTANGNIKSCITSISELRFGEFTLHNVVATLTPNLTQPLLGMNILSQFRIEQDNQEMRISKRP